MNHEYAHHPQILQRADCGKQLWALLRSPTKQSSRLNTRIAMPCSLVERRFLKCLSPHDQQQHALTEEAKAAKITQVYVLHEREDPQANITDHNQDSASFFLAPNYTSACKAASRNSQSQSHHKLPCCTYSNRSGLIPFSASYLRYPTN